MMFRDRLKVKFREATLDDSEIFSNLQNQYLSRYPVLDPPKTPEKFRLAIGSSLLKGNKYLVAEDENDTLGFLEQKILRNRKVRIGYPYVSFNHPKRKQIQLKLINESIENLRRNGVNLVFTEFSTNIEGCQELFKLAGFSNEKVVFQSWEGQINPDFDIDSYPYEFRKIKRSDIDYMYSWIKRQLDISSPLYITKNNLIKILSGPKENREGWAIATLDDKPVGLISSFQDINTDEIVIFGPFTDINHINARKFLLNELFIYYYLLGFTEARIMRIRSFDNDLDLFTNYNYEKQEEIMLMAKIL